MLPTTVLFACTHNAGRSQMAAALFNQLCDPALARAISAGTRPADRVHPEVVEAMREAGVDVAGARPRLLTPELAGEAGVLVTMGCGEECPYVPGVTVIDWNIPDPKGRPIDEVRLIRESVQACVVQLLHARGWGQRKTAGDP